MPSATGIRFVMEGPNAARIRLKKRARLVTACDACRSKKVKCLQINPDSACEGCKAGGADCSYADRDRFHAERGMTTVDSIPDEPSPFAALRAEGGLSFPDYSQMKNKATAAVPAVANVRASTSHNGEQQRYLQPSSHGAPSATSSPYVQPHQLYPNWSQSGEDQSASTSYDVDNTSHLFDSDRPNFPHPNLAIHLLHVFFDNLDCEFPFLDRQTILRRATTGTLPAVLHNSMVGLSSRFSDAPELISMRRDAVGEPFVKVAKMLTIQMMTTPSVDLLHALVLIAWAEYGSGHDRELFMYSRMAVAMLMDLGLENPQTIKGAKSEEEKDMLRLTWWCVARIDLTSSWVTGRTCAMRDPHYDIALPSTQHVYHAVPSRSLLFAYLTELLTIRKDLSNAMNGGSSDQCQASVLADIQMRLTNFYRYLPDSLAFNEDNFRSFSEHRQAPLLLLLHLGFQGLNAFAHWPSLFKDFSDPMPHSISVAYSSARAVVDMLRTTQRIDSTGLLGNPFFDTPISLAARVLLGARNSMGMGVASHLYSEVTNNAAFQTCVMTLSDLSKYWTGAQIVKEKLLESSPPPPVMHYSNTFESFGTYPSPPPVFSSPAYSVASFTSTPTASPPSATASLVESPQSTPLFTPPAVYSTVDQSLLFPQMQMQMPILTEEELTKTFGPALNDISPLTMPPMGLNMQDLAFNDFFTHPQTTASTAAAASDPLADLFNDPTYNYYSQQLTSFA